MNGLCLVRTAKTKSVAIIIVIIFILSVWYRTLTYSVGTATHTEMYSYAKLQSLNSEVLNAEFGGGNRHYFMKLPRVLIIGADGARTETLLRLLNYHPQVVAALDPKEINYYTEHYNRHSIEWYLMLMPLSFDNQTTIEHAPSYFYNPDVPERIREANQAQPMKFILSVTDPVKRIIKKIAIERGRGKLPPNASVESVLLMDSVYIDGNHQYVIESMYDIHLANWLKKFNIAQFHVVDNDNFIENPCGELQKLEQFLAVSKFFTASMFDLQPGEVICIKDSRYSRECFQTDLNVSYTYENTKRLQQIRTFLKRDVEQFSRMVAKRFNWEI